jgi:hypothetical protein
LSMPQTKHMRELGCLITCDFTSALRDGPIIARFGSVVKRTASAVGGGAAEVQ